MWKPIPLWRVECMTATAGGSGRRESRRGRVQAAEHVPLIFQTFVSAIGAIILALLCSPRLVVHHGCKRSPNPLLPALVLTRGAISPLSSKACTPFSFSLPRTTPFSLRRSVLSSSYILLLTSINSAQATAQLNRDFYKKPECIPALASIIANTPEEPVRPCLLVHGLSPDLSFRSVNSRPSSSGNACSTTAATSGCSCPRSSAKISRRTSLSSSSRRPGPFMLSLIFSFPHPSSSKLVRHATARVIAAIASIEIPLGNWQQLLPFLMQTVQSPQVAHREVGSFILFTVLENIVEGFQEHLGNFFQLFRQLLADPESIDVRITTVR
jgi:hypothetical protein